MILSKNAVMGIAAVVAASVLLVAGLGISTTTGAGTDISGAPDYPLVVPTANPPASPVEPPATNPGGNPAGTTDPNGGQAGAGANPAAGALPDAGYGVTNDGSALNSLVFVLAAAGMAFVGAGATVVATRRS